QRNTNVCGATLPPALLFCRPRQVIPWPVCIRYWAVTNRCLRWAVPYSLLVCCWSLSAGTSSQTDHRKVCDEVARISTNFQITSIYSIVIPQNSRFIHLFRSSIIKSIKVSFVMTKHDHLGESP